VRPAYGQEFDRVGSLDVGGTADTNQPSFTTFSADSKQIAVGDYLGQIHVFTTAGRKISVCPRQAATPGVEAIYFNSGGLLAAYSELIVSAFDPRTGKRLGVIEISEQGLCETALSPDGRLLAVTDRQTKLTGGKETCVLKLVDLRTRKMVRAVDLNDQGPCAVAFNPNGRSVAVVKNQRNVAFFDVATLKHTKTLQASAAIEEVYEPLDYSPDGKSLILACELGTYELWDLDKEEQHVRKTENGVNTVAFSPSGKYFAIGGSEGYLALCSAETGVVQKQLTTGHAEGIHVLAFSPDGRLLATGGQNATVVHLWDVSAWSKTPAGPPAEKEPDATEFVPEEGEQNKTRIWTSANGRFTVRARLLEHDDKNARLEKEGGGEITVPLEKLSARDRAYLRSLLKSIGATTLAKKNSVTQGNKPEQWISKNASYDVSSVHAHFTPLPYFLTGSGKVHDESSAFSFHTQLDGKDPYVIIDLGEKRTVTKIYIQNRGHLTAGDTKRIRDPRVETLTVWLALNATNFGKPVWQVERPQLEWTIQLQPTEARYVKIGLRQKEALHLKHVKIFGR